MSHPINLHEAARILRQQEELLRVDSFSNRDAWTLGCLMVEESARRGIGLAACIRKLNGNIVFQAAGEGTDLTNQLWMERKYRTVALMERSSLLATVDCLIAGQRIPDMGLSEADYVLCGGGFPIRGKGGNILMIATVSALPHELDHAFFVDCLSKFLAVPAPQLPEDTVIPMG